MTTHPESAITRFDARDNEPQLVRLEHGEAACFSDISPIKQAANEDAAAIIPVDPDTTVLVVADGMGGMPAGEQASRIVVESLIHACQRKTALQQTRDAVLNGIEAANQHILSLMPGSGSTVSVAEISGNRLRTCHAGDSLILLTGHDGSIRYLPMSHSPVGFALECGAIEQQTAMEHSERNLVSNYVGSHDMYIHIGPMIELAPRDTLIIASDGLSDNLYEQEISDLIHSGTMPDRLNEMIKSCRHNMLEIMPNRCCHPDDFSFTCFRQYS